ncbi:MAG TPA: hypothetical protein VHE55_15995 [Fimbriimonadaceae bacterium]|nr:hypothetical protein [Fimbriimonadaceae bacterium]
MKTLDPITREEFVKAFDYFGRNPFFYRALFKETGSRALTEALLVAAFAKIQADAQAEDFKAMTTTDQCSYLFTLAKEFDMFSFTSDPDASQSFAADPEDAIYVSVSFYDLDAVARQSIVLYNAGSEVEQVFAEMLSFFDLGVVDKELVDKYLALGVEGLRRRLEIDWRHLLTPREKRKEVPL